MWAQKKLLKLYRCIRKFEIKLVFASHSAAFTPLCSSKAQFTFHLIACSLLYQINISSSLLILVWYRKNSGFYILIYSSTYEIMRNI